MKAKTSDPPSARARNTILVGIGTTGIRCVNNHTTRERIAGHAPEDRVKVLGFDAPGVNHSNPMPTVNKNLQDIGLVHGQLVGASIGDLESRREAEDSGRTWMAPPNFAQDPGAAIEDTGSAGNLRTARTIFGLNQNRIGAQFINCLRRCRDYQEQATAGTKNPDATEQTVTQVYVVASLVGGIGPGTVMAAIQTMAEKAAALKIPVHIIPILLLMGTLNPGDQRAAARNQQLALRSIQAHFEARFKPLTSLNGDFQIVCDLPVFISNSNTSGEMADLKLVIALVGQWLYIQTHTPLGPIFRQEAINLQDLTVKDGSGDRRRAATTGLSVINLNKDKVKASVVVKWLKSFFSHLLRKSGSGAAAQSAAVALTSAGLKETPTDDTAVQRLYGLRHHGNVNVQERSRAVFQERMGNRTGFRGCTDIYRAAHYTLDQEVPHALIPRMAQEASAVVQEAEEMLVNEISRYLQKETGLVEGPQFLETMQELLETSEKANQDKLARAQQRNRNLRQAQTAAEKTYAQLQKKMWPFRWLHFFMKARFRRTYPRCVAARIRNELEIAGRRLLSKKVFPQTRKVVIAQNARLQRIRSNVQTLCDAASQELYRLENLPNGFYVAAGHEMANCELTTHVYTDVVTDEGGPSRAVRRLFDVFCERFHSLEAFSQAAPEEISMHLADYCQNTAASFVESLNVLDVFTDEYAQHSQQCEVIGTLIAQSDGRIKTSGECYQDIARLKYIIGPDTKSVQYVVAIANAISRLGGDWRGHVEPAATGIFFLQYRAGVSITQQIRDTMKFYQLPDDPEELAQLGEDPIVALAPDTDVAEGKLDVTIAQALVSGQIHRNGRGCELRQAESTLVLGTLLDEIRAALAASHETRMAIYRQFCLELTREHERLLQMIETIIANHGSDEAKLAVSVDKAAFERVQALSRSLVPYTSRMRLDLRLMRKASEKGRV